MGFHISNLVLFFTITEIGRLFVSVSNSRVLDRFCIVSDTLYSNEISEGLKEQALPLAGLLLVCHVGK
jgi:hypothetical protein